MTMRRSRAAVTGPIAALGALLALSACSTTTAGQANPPATTVSGTLRMVGGAMGGGQPGVPGEVVFTAADKHAVAQAATDGSFTASLAPGTYKVTGTSRWYDNGQRGCSADSSVVVTRTAVAGLVVGCWMP